LAKPFYHGFRPLPLQNLRNPLIPLQLSESAIRI